MSRALALAFAAAVLLSLPAYAQTVAVERPQPERPSPPVRVQVSVNLFVPTAGAEADEPGLQQARRALYEVAGHECDLLREVLAKECRLESINVNFNRQGAQQYWQAGQQPSGVLANAHFTLQFVPK